SALKTENPFIQQMVDYLARSQGKRVRPALAVLAARHCGRVTEETIALGAALEMLHVATLIHDDIIDNSAVRRKQKTLNFKWGNEVSVLMGDYVFASSFYLMAKNLPKDVLGILADTTNTICRGEISETANRFNVGLTLEEYEKIVREKTACLFAASCQTGALMAGAPPETTARFERFGLGIGMAFQIVDDTLDFVGRAKKVGKPVMSDLREGKLTLPVLLCRERSSAAERKRIKAMILRKVKTPADFQRLAGLLKRTGAIELSLTRAKEWVEEAKAAIAPLEEDRGKSELLRFADFLLDRDF
ncbi:MAG TPA: polyprenyl synthetase family protein, partial [bacterium]|nr:polyprenyl synthetase family protein [bacterium]